MHSHIDQPDSAHTVYGPTVSACVINMQIQVENSKGQEKQYPCKQAEVSWYCI